MSTSTVVEQVTSLVDAVGREHAEQRRRAYTEYRVLLMKNHKPTEADAERLHALLDELRLTPDDMRCDLAVLREAEGHEAIIVEVDQSQAVYDAVHAKLCKHKVETKKITAKRRDQQAELENTRVTALCKVKDIHLAAKLLEKLRAEHCELFGTSGE